MFKKTFVWITLCLMIILHLSPLFSVTAGAENEFVAPDANPTPQYNVVVLGDSQTAGNSSYADFLNGIDGIKITKYAQVSRTAKQISTLLDKNLYKNGSSGEFSDDGSYGSTQYPPVGHLSNQAIPPETTHVILWAGGNDLPNVNYDEKKVSDTLWEVVTKVKSLYKGTETLKVIVCYVTPGGESKKERNEALPELNKKIGLFATGEPKIDTYSIVADTNGVLKKEFNARDELHVNTEAHKLIAKEIAKEVFGVDDGTLNNITPATVVNAPENGESSSNSGSAISSGGTSLDLNAVQLGAKIPIGEFGSQVENSNASYFFVYLIKVFRWVAGIVGVFGVLMVVVGGLQIAISRGNTGLVDAGRKRISGAVVGIALLFTSSIILITINPQFYKTEGDMMFSQNMAIEDTFRNDPDYNSNSLSPGGVSYTNFNNENCETNTTSITVPIKNYANKDDTLTLEVSSQLAQEITEIFQEIYQNGGKIDKSHSGGFSCRAAVGGKRMSAHGLGIAIDLNFDINMYYDLKPAYKGFLASRNGVASKDFTSTDTSIRTFTNPKTTSTITLDNSNWKDFTQNIVGKSFDFSGQVVGSIHPNNPEGNVIIKAFKAKGWGWGGDWTNKKDYMHFSKDGS